MRVSEKKIKSDDQRINSLIFLIFSSLNIEKLPIHLTTMRANETDEYDMMLGHITIIPFPALCEGIKKSKDDYDRMQR